MLLTEGLINLIFLNLRILSFLGSHLYEIDPISYNITFHNSSVFKKDLLAKCSAKFALFTTMLIQLIAYRRVFSNAQQFESILYVVAAYAFFGTSYIYYFRKTQVLKLYNSLVELEQQFINGRIFPT